MNYHLIMAMNGEANHIVSALNLIQLDDIENVHVYHQQINGHSIHLFVNKKDDGMDKIGTVHAALLTYKAIKFCKPDLIINLGTCGGIHSKDIKIFDIICANKFIIYHDRYGGDDDKSLKQSLGFLPCLDLSAQFTEYKHGVVGTSNSLIVNKKNWEMISKYHVQCVDMEAAAVAEVAAEFFIPFVAFKVVTDLVYEVNPIDALPQFQENFHKSVSILASNIKHILNIIHNHSAG